MITHTHLCSCLLIISSITSFALNTDDTVNEVHKIYPVFNLNDEYNITYDWDVLIFTQQWPITSCIHWMSENSDNKCILPPLTEKEFWTVHGIWPTKFGTIGPSFCNKTSVFNVNVLKPIIEDLKKGWPNIEDGMSYYSLWKHEWDKHGTCAANNENLDNELKYFNQGIDWRNKYLISDILGNAGIHPDSKNDVSTIQNTLKKTLGTNPSIHCLYDRKKDISYLSEIRICFDKSLKLIDCDGISGADHAHVAVDYPGGKLITNCHISKTVVYPSDLPMQFEDKNAWNFNFWEVFKLLNFVMWLTL